MGDIFRLLADAMWYGKRFMRDGCEYYIIAKVGLEHVLAVRMDDPEPRHVYAMRTDIKDELLSDES